MSELVDILRGDRALVCSRLTEKLQRADYEGFATAVGGDYGPMVDALIAFLHAEDRAPIRAWARAIHARAADVGLSFSQLLAGLSGVEKVIRVRVVERLDSKKALLLALRDLTDAVDLVRRTCAQEVLGPGEQEPLRSPELLALLDLAGEPFILATPQGRPFFVNRAGRQLLGIEQREGIDEPTLEPFHSQTSWTALCRHAIDEVKRTGQWQGATQIRNRQTDELTDVQTTMVLVRHPVTRRPACLAIVHHPGRQVSQLEATIQEYRATRDAILESSLDPIITINYEGKITEFNRAAERVFGWKRQDVLGAQASEILFPDAQIAGDDSRINRYLQKGEGSMLGQRREVTAVRADGETFPVELAMTMVKEQGEPVMTFFVRDIRERKAAEEAQARHRQELERSNRELEQFAYIVSHDLQEPLRKISAFGQRLESHIGHLLDETGREYVRRMQDAADRMQALIEGLLTLSRVTTEGEKFVAVDLTQVVREVMADLEVQIEEVQGRIEVGKLPTVQADPVQMRQLFQNLIGNALKFRRPEVPPLVKVHGRLLAEDRQVGRESVTEQLCRITIEDNGIGFDEQYAASIFDVFQRLHRRDRYSGAGVGLAICKKIVERHGGSITASSTPGQGSKFAVLLPATQPEAA